MPWQINEVVISTDSPADGDSARTKEEAKNVAPWGHTPCDARQLLKKTKKTMLKVCKWNMTLFFYVFLRFLFSPKKVVVIFPSPKLARRQIGIHRHAIGAEPRGEFTIHFVEETHFLDNVLMNLGQVHHVSSHC